MKTLYNSFKENDSPIMFKRIDFEDREEVKYLLPELTIDKITISIDDFFVQVIVEDTDNYWFNTRSLPIFYVKSHYDIGKITAHMEKGVLTLVIPYTEKYKAEQFCKEEFERLIKVVKEYMLEIDKAYEY